jgi:amino acid transporter
MSVFSDSSIVFGWFVNITTVAGLIGWIVIEVTYLRFHAGLAAQGHTREGKCGRTTLSHGASSYLYDLELPYRSPLQPYTAWATLFMVVMVVLFSGMWD